MVANRRVPAGSVTPHVGQPIVEYVTEYAAAHGDFAEYTDVNMAIAVNGELSRWFARVQPIPLRYIGKGDGIKGTTWNVTEILHSSEDVTQNVILLSNTAIGTSLVSARWTLTLYSFDLVALEHRSTRVSAVYPDAFDCDRALGGVMNMSDCIHLLRCYPLWGLRIFWIGNYYVRRNLAELRLRSPPGDVLK